MNKQKKMIQIMLCVFLLFSFQGCDNNEEKIELDGSYLSLTINSSEQFSQFISLLDKKGLHYRLVNEKTILFLARDEGTISELEKKMHSTDLPIYSISFEGQGYEKQLIDFLELNKIQYDVKKRYGQRWIVWSKGDDDKVQQFIIDLTDAIAVKESKGSDSIDLEK